MTEENGEYSGAFGGWEGGRGKRDHFEESPEDAGVARQQPTTPSFSEAHIFGVTL